MARLTPTALTGPHEREHPGIADRGRPEPEALPGRYGLGTTKCPVWEPCGPSGAARSVLSCLRVITNQPGDRGTSELNPGDP
jgi:hypothetical protein